MFALGAIGWGLFAVGALQHGLSLNRLVALLERHIAERPTVARALAWVVFGLESLIAVGVPIAWALELGQLGRALAAVGTALGAGFVLWIVRLLRADSPLPCACSTSDKPATAWSLLRAGATIAVAGTAVAGTPDAEHAAMLVAGLALAAGIFVLPEALAWPDAAVHMRKLASGSS